MNRHQTQLIASHPQNKQPTLDKEDNVYCPIDMFSLPTKFKSSIRSTGLHRFTQYCLATTVFTKFRHPTTNPKSSTSTAACRRCVCSFCRNDDDDHRFFYSANLRLILANRLKRIHRKRLALLAAGSCVANPIESRTNRPSSTR